MVQNIIVDEKDNIRIDRYLSDHCEGFSRSYLQKLLKSGEVFINGKGIWIFFMRMLTFSW